jgi:hypothetical protein
MLSFLAADGDTFFFLFAGAQAVGTLNQWYVRALPILEMTTAGRVRRLEVDDRAPRGVRCRQLEERPPRNNRSPGRHVDEGEGDGEE